MQLESFLQSLQQDNQSIQNIRLILSQLLSELSKTQIFIGESQKLLMFKSKEFVSPKTMADGKEGKKEQVNNQSEQQLEPLRVEDSRPRSRFRFCNIV